MPANTTTLSKIYRVLGYNPEHLFSQQPELAEKFHESSRKGRLADTHPCFGHQKRPPETAEKDGGVWLKGPSWGRWEEAGSRVRIWHLYQILTPFPESLGHPRLLIFAPPLKVAWIQYPHLVCSCSQGNGKCSALPVAEPLSI